MRMWIEKQRNLIDFTLSSLARRKGKNLALFTLYTALIFLLASVLFFTHSLRKEAAMVLQAAPEMVVQRMAAGRHDLIPEDYAARIKTIKGVSEVNGRLWGYYFDPVAGANYTLMVPVASPPDPGSIIIGQGISRVRSAMPGDILPIRGYDGRIVNFTIASVLSVESELLSSDLMLMSAEDYRSLFRVPAGHFTDLTITVRNSHEVPVVAAKIVSMLPDSRPISRREILRTYESIFDWRGGIVVVILASAILSFIIFAMDKATGLSAEERKEIGILKAVGWETSDVLLMKFWEGSIISLTAFLTGVILAYVHVFFSSAVLFAPVLKGWSTLYPEFRLTPDINASQVAVLFFLTVVPYSVATIIPSWRAATIDPDSVMRS